MNLTRRRHLDFLILLVIVLFLGYVFFFCRGFIYRKGELTKDHSSISCCHTPSFKEQSRVHLIHAPKKTTYIITECIEINVTI
jgi:hypothetical protein